MQSMDSYPRAAMERAMKVQEVILQAMTKKITRYQAAERLLYGIGQFTYMPEENCYIYPEGKVLKYTGINKHSHTHVYFSTPKRCRECSQKSRCTRGKYRTIAIHTCEEARQRAHARAETPEFAVALRKR